MFSGAGSNSVTNNARFIATVSAANLSLAGGALTGGDGTPVSRATLNGKADWSAGDLLGAWTLPVCQVITAKPGGAKRLRGTDLVIDGSLKWRTGNPVQGYNGAVLANNGLFEARKTTSLSWVAGGQPSFVNNATGLVRASGKGRLTMGNFNIVSQGGRFETKALSTIDFNGGTVRFNDNTRYLGAGGVIQVSGNATFVGLQQSENLKLVAGNLTGGDGTLGSLATLRGPVTWQGGTLQNNDVLSPGEFTVAQSALASPWVGAGQRLAQSSTLATLTIAGGLSQGAGGQMDLQVTNATSTDKLIVGGNVVVGGTLNIGCLGSCSFVPGNQMVLLDATGTLSGTFSSVTYSGLPPGSFNISYDNAGGRVILTATGPVNLAPQRLPGRGRQ